MLLNFEFCRLLRKELEAQERAKVQSRQLPDSVPDGCGHVVSATRMSRMETAINNISNEREPVRETRLILIQQLAESEALEAKQNLLVSQYSRTIIL